MTEIFSRKKDLKFLKKKNYIFDKELESGGFGDVIAIKKKKRFYNGGFKTNA